MANNMPTPDTNPPNRLSPVGARALPQEVGEVTHWLGPNDGTMHTASQDQENRQGCLSDAAGIRH